MNKVLKEFAEKFIAMNTDWRETGFTKEWFIPPQDAKPMLDFIEAKLKESYNNGRIDEQKKLMSNYNLLFSEEIKAIIKQRDNYLKKKIDKIKNNLK